MRIALAALVLAEAQVVMTVAPNATSPKANARSAPLPPDAIDAILPYPLTVTNFTRGSSTLTATGTDAADDPTGTQVVSIGATATSSAPGPSDAVQGPAPSGTLSGGVVLIGVGALAALAVGFAAVLRRQNVPPRAAAARQELMVHVDAELRSADDTDMGHEAEWD